MKKLMFPIFALGIIFFSLSCEKEVDCSHSINSMNLDELQVGQVFRFVLFTAESYSDPNNFNFEYTGDTLKVTVMGQQNGKFLLTEAITPQSNMMLDTTRYYWYDKDSVYANYWEVKNDSLLVTPANGRSYTLSHLIFDRNQLPLADFDGEEVNIRNWKPEISFPITDPSPFTRDYTLFGHTYDRLNVLIDNGPMAYDGPGSTLIYSREYGFVKTSIYSAWTSEGQGWDRLD